MGAQSFEVYAKGKTAREAFAKARDEAQWECGHGGYTGTIAEKGTFVVCGSAKTEVEARRLVNNLFNEDDRRIADKWGPAGCVEIHDGTNTFIFFGYASS
jgi:hypothetical protein